MFNAVILLIILVMIAAPAMPLAVDIAFDFFKKKKRKKNKKFKETEEPEEKPGKDKDENPEELYNHPEWKTALSHPNKLKAIEIYNRLLTKFRGQNEQISIYENLGVLYHFEFLDYKKSIEMFERILLKEPSNAYALLMAGKNFLALSLKHQETESPEKAEYLGKAENFLFKASRANAAYCIDLAKFYILQDKLRLAQDALQKAANVYVTDNTDDAGDTGINGEGGEGKKSSTYKPALILLALTEFLRGDNTKAKELLKESNAGKKQMIREMTKMTNSSDGIGVKTVNASGDSFFGLLEILETAN